MFNCSCLDGVVFEGSLGASKGFGVDGPNFLSNGFLSNAGV